MVPEESERTIIYDKEDVGATQEGAEMKVEGPPIQDAQVADFGNEDVKSCPTERA